LCESHGIEVITLKRTNNGATQPIIARESEETLTKICQAGREAKDQKTYKYREATYEASLQSYLDALKSEGQPLPRRAGQPNKAVIAKACGFHRDVLYSYETVVAMLEEFDTNELNLLNRNALDPVSLLTDYLNNLKQSGSPLPKSRNSRPNKQIIAKACGFHRKVLYTNPSAIAALEAYLSSEKY
jgi:hypothetical protein